MDGDVPRLTGPREQEHTPEESQRAKQESPRDHAQAHQAHIPSANQVKAAMAQLAGMVLMGLVTPGRASVVQRIFEALLRNGQPAGGRSTTDHLDVSELRTVFRQHPQVADTFAPFLDPVLLQAVLRGEDPAR